MNKIVLNMIVKNEAHVLRRALDSARPYVDEYCIVDTGSSDGTQDIIAEYGPLYARPWVNFGHNRQEALELARETKCDYALFLDADDVLSTVDTTAGSAFSSLSLAGYTLPITYGDTSYRRCALVQTKAPWRWEGVIHEYLTSDIPLAQGSLDEPHIIIMSGGARSLDPDKYRKDALLLEDALAKDPTNARYAFYLAQSWRDAGEPWRAIAAYRHRADMPGWVEETWYALYQVARLLDMQKAPVEEVVRAYHVAYQARPTRAETLFYLAQLHRLRDEHALGYLYAARGLATKRPPDVLFVDASIYAWRMAEELALNAYYVGRKDEGRLLIKRLLEEGLVPESHRDHLTKTLKWYE